MNCCSALRHCSRLICPKIRSALLGKSEAAARKSLREPVLVLDASVLIELLVPGRRATAIRKVLRKDTSSWHVPHLADVEVTQVLRRFERAGALASRRAERALQHLGELDLVRHSHEPFLARVWAHRNNLSAYDATYLALAEALPAHLLTADRGLARIAGHFVKVQLIE